MTLLVSHDVSLSIFVYRLDQWGPLGSGLSHWPWAWWVLFCRDRFVGNLDWIFKIHRYLGLNRRLFATDLQSQRVLSKVEEAFFRGGIDPQKNIREGCITCRTQTVSMSSTAPKVSTMSFAFEMASQRAGWSTAGDAAGDRRSLHYRNTVWRVGLEELIFAFFSPAQHQQ